MDKRQDGGKEVVCTGRQVHPLWVGIANVFYPAVVRYYRVTITIRTGLPLGGSRVCLEHVIALERLHADGCRARNSGNWCCVCQIHLQTVVTGLLTVQTTAVQEYRSVCVNWSTNEEKELVKTSGCKAGEMELGCSSTKAAATVQDVSLPLLGSIRAVGIFSLSLVTVHTQTGLELLTPLLLSSCVTAEFILWFVPCLDFRWWLFSFITHPQHQSSKLLLVGEGMWLLGVK